MGRNRRARRQARAREFGARHPRVTLVIVGALLAGVVAICGYQLRHGTYLGPGWVVAALAGMATAAGLAATTLISHRRHSPAASRLGLGWLVLTMLSASSIRYPFPLGRYDRVQAFFNVVHASLLGYEAVTCTAIVALLGYLVVHPRVGASGRAARTGQGPALAGLPAGLRSPEVTAATWRAGHLIAANGKVTWVSLEGDTEVDLTSACQALLTLPADTHGRQPRTTTLATADGMVELDVSPRALAAQADSLYRPHLP